MRILVTGATGFAGGHLVEALLARGGAEVVGLNRQAQWPAEWPHLAGRARLVACDLCDAAGVEAVLREVQPDQIYHLAGYAQTGKSFKEPDAAWAGNLTATRTLYEGIVRWGGQPRILFVGSGLIYGELQHPDEAFHEEAVLHPMSPYAASKAAADLVSYQFFSSAKLGIIRARPFNHFGPRQAPNYAVSEWTQKIVAIERNRLPPVLETGDLRPLRDFTDVRDTVRAYLLLMERGCAGEAYNIGTGQAVSMQEVLDRLLARAGVRVEVRQRADLVRAADAAAVRADAGKLRRETGWAPRYTLDETLTTILDYWRQRA